MCMTSAAIGQPCDAREWLDAMPAAAQFSPLVAGYSAARERVLLLTSSPRSGPDRADYQTWEWDGESMTLRSTVSSSSLTSLRLASDPVRGVTIATGSFHDLGPLAEWNGEAWNAIEWPWESIPQRPEAVAFDFTRSQLMSLTQGANGQLHTWTYNGKEWLLLSESGPSNTADVELICDRDRNVMVLNTRASAPASMDTWEWDGKSWALIRAAHAASAKMAYDANRRRVVATFGSCVVEWEGGVWRALACLPDPIDALAFDERRGRLGAFITQGRNHNFPYHTDSVGVWEMDPGTQEFTEIVPNVVGRLRVNPVFDEAHGEAIVFGGQLDVPLGATVNETLRFTGDRWEPVDAPHAPAPRQAYAATFDSLNNQMLLFGGMDDHGAALPDTTWIWDGTDWIPSDTPGPSPRFDSAMAHDRARGRTVLFGGQVLPHGAFGDTWEWDGAEWILAASDGPAARYGHAMAYDPVHGRGTGSSGPRSARSNAAGRASSTSISSLWCTTPRGGGSCSVTARRQAAPCAFANGTGPLGSPFPTPLRATSTGLSAASSFTTPSPNN